jgi:cell division septum initiation protein DivIVA
LLLKEQNEKLSLKNNELTKQIKDLQTQLESLESAQATLQNQLSQPKKGTIHTPIASRSHSPTRSTPTTKKTSQYDKLLSFQNNFLNFSIRFDVFSLLYHV